MNSVERAEATESKLATNATWFAFFLIVVTAAFFRFWHLEDRPLHHDEGVNGFFLTNLIRQNSYKYDPSNYHGPSLYYLSLPFVAIFGLTTFAIRAVVATFGLATVFVLFRWLKRENAAFGLAATLLFSVSPGITFFSRYFIHETLFLFFTLASVVALFEWRRDAETRLLAFALFGALFFATKETHFVSAGALIGAALLAFWIVRDRSPIRSVHDALAFLSRNVSGLLAALGVFLFISVVLYTSIFKNMPGIIDAFRTLSFWTKTAARDHVYGWRQHIDWLREADPSLLYLGAIGGLLALVLHRSLIAVIATFWAGALLFAYSVVGYKTPWLGINILLPLSITAGYLVAEVAGAWEKAPAGGRMFRGILAAAVALPAAGVSAREAFDLNFIHFDREEHAYIYAHTQRDFLKLVALIDQRVSRLPKGRGSSIAVFAPENWPLPWYLRDYTATGFWGEYKHDIDADVYVGSLEQDGVLNKKTGDAYERFGPFHMRGTVQLVVYIRRP